MLPRSGQPLPVTPRSQSQCRLLAVAIFAAHLLCVLTRASAQDYDVPDPIIQAFYPKGLKVSIPDADGVELFAFHGNVNRPLHNVEAGEMSVDIMRRTGDLWTYYNPQKRLKVGDVIHYWLYVQRDGRGYQRLHQSYEVTELISTTSTPITDPEQNVQRPDDRPSQSGLSPGTTDEYGSPPPTFESRPPPPRDPYETRPPPQDSRPPPHDSRPPPYDSRPPPHDSRPPPHDSRPPPYDSRPPPQDSRPPPHDSRPPPYDSRPPPQDSRPPPQDSRPPPQDSRPPPYDSRPSGSLEYHPPHYGARPPPPPAHNFEYPPPPPPDQPVSNGNVIHNHHVGFAANNNNHHNHNTVDRYPDTGSSNNNYHNEDRYPTCNKCNNNNEDRYPTNNNNAVSPPTASRPTASVGTSTDTEFMLGVVSPAAGEWGQGAGQGAGTGAGTGTGAGVGLPLSGDRFTVPPPLTPATGCELSATHVNGQPACKGQVVFEEDWKTLNLGKWAYEVKISGSPDFEFCIYAQHPENTVVKNGLLHLKPTLTNDKYGADFVRKGKLQLDDCTAGPANSESCTREAMFSYILPPVVASRINTKNNFSFKYGKIEVRARLPRGDWIYPELWLQPLREEYGPGLASGRILLAMARGNRQLRGPAPESDDLSGRSLVVGVLAGGRNMGSAAARRKFFTRNNDKGLWAEQFHNYTLLWTPETLAFSVDGVEIGVARPEEFGGLLHGRADDPDPWTQGSRMAPFDKEFYISLGLAVGGIHAFPDGCKSGNHDKPWKNTGAKAMLSFWNAKNNWHPTWNGPSDMLVESVRVTALNN